MKLLSVLDHSSRLRPGGSSGGSDHAIDLARLASRIEYEGIDAIAPATLAEVARLGRVAGLHPEVAAVVADPAAPIVVRGRVFGLIHRRLADTPLDSEPLTRLAA